MSQEIRPAAVAGRFYPGDARSLAACVDALLGEAAPAEAIAARPKLILVPHAGYVYSGPVAAGAYARLAPLRGRIERVVLLGPTHRVPVRGLALPAAEAFETPLGRVPIDRAAVAQLADLPQVLIDDAAHALEHALEVQLPFLQRVLGDFALLPLAVGRATPSEVAEVVERLWGGDETLVVVSSDLSHYLPYDEARVRDRATIARVLALDPRLAHDEACGATPLAGALIAARAHGLAPLWSDLRNSGDTAGDRHRVVGYGTVLFGAVAQADDDADEDEAALGAALIAQARHAIATRHGWAAGLAPAAPAALDANGATFVTLRRHGALRGCIGSLHARRALHEDVRAHAVAAAFADPRFAPLTLGEYAEIDIEVSLLDAPEPMAAASEAEALAALRAGEDGVVIEWRGRRATFLPQVWEQLPDPRDFLRALRRKAGLAEDFWAADLTLARYRVRKFVEASVSAAPGRPKQANIPSGDRPAYSPGEGLQ